MAKAQAKAPETHAFQAEMQQLLHIIIHSLYSEREVFLRELISNASDALNKHKFGAITNPDVRDKEQPLEITLTADAEAKTLVIEDTGIGMTRDDLINNLGTIARSGTLEFIKELSAADSTQRLDLIGQFGVGFYAVFMVASKVVVDTCPANPKEDAWQWTSDGSGEFQLAPSERKTRGTTIRMELKEDCEEFSQSVRLEGVVKKYSNFVPYPIQMDGRQLNAQQAIWSQSKSEVKAEEYNEFYKFITHGLDEPMHTLHLSIDAPVQYQALLFIPPHLPNDALYSPSGFGLQLYANKVMIQSQTQDLLPLYLRFMRGVVDTEDLPLNVSREMVQQHPMLAKLRQSLTGRVLRDLKSLAESNNEKYLEFWKQYGRVFKEGLAGDEDNRERLLELARFNSSTCSGPEEFISLKDYIGRMQDEQKEIFYFTGPTREAIERNPNLEYFRKNKLEVLYMYDQVDDVVMAHLTEFDGKTFASIDQSNLDAFEKDGAESQVDNLPEGELAPVLEFFKESLGERVSAVNASKRLIDSPACLVAPGDMPANFEKMMRVLNHDFKGAPKVLEINPGHPLVRNMASLLKAGGDNPLLKELAEQVFDNCLLVEGLIEHPEQMVERIQSLMTRTAELQAGALSKE